MEPVFPCFPGAALPGLHFLASLFNPVCALADRDAASLIAAPSVMAAPCALALSKLVYPEVEESKFRSEEGVKLTYG